MPRKRNPASAFRYFNSGPEIIRLVVRMYVRFPLSLRRVEDLLFERGIDICHETVRLWRNRFGPLLAGGHKAAACEPHARLLSLTMAPG
jgi:putative transposase